MPGSAAAGTLGFLAGCFLKTTVVLTLALLAAAAAKRRPAAIRHFILSSALIGLLLLPLLTVAPVGWKSPLLPAWLAAPAPRTASAPAASAAQTARAKAGGIAVTVENKGGAGVDPSGAVSYYLTSSSDDQAVGGSSTPLLLGPLGPGQAARRSGSQAADLVVALLWSAGLAALLLRLAFGLAGASRLTTEGTPLDSASWRLLLDRFLTLVSLRRNVRLKSHPQVLVPLTWGWRRPVVLLPDGSDSWTDDERSSALFHELSHVKRADFLVMLLVRASLAVFWWNPLCWVVYRELQKEQEIACDELVLRAGIRPSTYAATLLAFRRAAGFRWNPSAALLGMLGKSSFQDRLAAILKQKLTFMEVKMKTKIMLALALVLAVALVGTARPVSGTEAKEGTPVLAETALPAPASFAIAAPGAGLTQAEKAVVQETEQEKAKAAEKAKKVEKAIEAEKAAKEKAAVTKTFVITPVGAEGKTIEVIITEGDQVKKLVLEKPLTITKSKDGEALVLTVDGKDVQVLKGEPVRIEINGGDLQVIKEGKPLDIGKPMRLKIAKEGGDEGETIVFYRTGDPEIGYEKIKLAEKAEGGEERSRVIVKTRKDMKEGARWVAKGAGGRSYAWTIAKDGEMLEKVHALQEQVQAIKAKKMDLSALEESLKKLEAELAAKEDKLQELQLKLEKVPGQVAVVKRVGGDESEGQVAVWVAEKDAEKDKKADEARAYVKVMSKDEGAITIVIGEKGLGREAYERALSKLKNELPEGFTLVEQEFEADSGTMTFKIAAPKGQKGVDEELVKKLVDGLRAEIDKK